VSLRDLVKRHQPQCLINARIGHGLHDYLSLGDNEIPPDNLGQRAEACITLNDTWGFKQHDHNWKSARQVTELAATLNSRNCNMLINVGPDASGRFPQPAQDVLLEFGRRDF